MKAVLCFGELLLRMSPLPATEWMDNETMPVYIGGAELNVAMALANWHQPVKYCSAVPKNYLSEDIIKILAVKNIDVSAMHVLGSRIGIYFLSQGADLKHADVIYDREHSSFSELLPGMINWNQVLENVSWFHLSAIAPAVSAGAAAVCEEALIAASQKDLTISVDLNYRSKLWKFGKQPVEIMPALIKYADIIMGNIWSANTLLGIPVDADIHDKESKDSYIKHAAQTAVNIRKQFPKCKAVAQTFRFNHNSGVKYYGVLDNMDTQYISKEYILETTTDKVGSGDCFMAGLIYGMRNNHSPQYIIDFAAAAATGKMNETGDNTKQTVKMIEKVLADKNN